VTGPKLNERPVMRRRIDGPAQAVDATTTTTRAVARYVRMSAYKVREVLDLIRGHDTERAQEILRFCERDAATLVGKVLASAVANAEHNESVPADELYVSACFADEGPTLKRWRPRARGRATRIRKRTCHVTVIVSRLPELELRKRRAAKAPTAADRRRRAARPGTPAGDRERRVRGARKAAVTPEVAPEDAAPAPPAVQEPEPTGAEPTGAEPTTETETEGADDRESE
jgi:large subunit ribosomal protein L22